jgi:hypothetical protein
VFGVFKRRPADDGMDFVVLFQQQLSQIRSILSRDTGNESFPLCHKIQSSLELLPPAVPKDTIAHSKCDRAWRILAAASHDSGDLGKV